MTKIDVFSGFLGAGKTTLIKKLIKEAYNGQKVVLIENEFGEIAVDGGFLNDAGIEITEMNSGCICCSLVGDFNEALKKVLEQYSPDRILIEPSGVGKLSDVVKAVGGVLNDDVVLNSTTAVVDVTKCKMYMKNFGEFFNNQVESAGCIVLSRTGKCDAEKIKQATEMLREKNQTAVIITTPWESLNGAEILKAMEQKETISEILKQMKDEDEDVCPVCGHHHEHEHHHDHDECCEHEHDHHHDHDECCEHDHDHHHDHDECCEHEHEHHHDHDECCEHDHEHHHHHHHADEVFSDWGCETSKSFSPDEIKAALNELENSEKYGMVLRAKGFVDSNDCWTYFDYVPGESNVRKGEPSVTGRICVIGSKLNEQELKKLFGV